jgi:predicted SnoaL-like aldol condensation-catalyzing enzyme
MTDKAQAYKQAAVQFLKLVVAGRIDEAYDKHADPGGRHHNAYFPAGFPALKKGMLENHDQFPGKKFTIINVLGDGDLVAVHSHVALRPGEPGIAVVHLFRFQDDKIVEMWDVGQAVPPDSPNKDGMF